MKIPGFITKALTNYFRWVLGGIAVIVLIAGYALVISPKLTEVQTNQGTARKNAEADLKSQQEFLAALRTSNAKFTTVLSADNIAKINNFIPSEPDFPGLLLTVKNIVSQSQLTLDSFSVGQAGQVAATPATSTSGSTAANLKTQDVSISVSGGSSYDGFKKLLTVIESSQRLFDVISVNFSADKPAAPGSAQTPVASTNSWSLVLRTYYLPTR